MKHLFISSLSFICLILSKLHGLEVNGIVAFGDSLSCNGNTCIHATNPSPICTFYPQKRFTDGDVWLEVFADELDLPRPRASLAGGFNFAYGGATTGWEHSPNILNVGNQIESYLERVKGKADPASLFVLWVGCNDIKNNIIPQSLIPNLKRHITRLAKAGGKIFFIPNYPPLFQTPLVSGASYLFGLGLEKMGDYFDFKDNGVQEVFTTLAGRAADFGTIALNEQLKKMLFDLERSLGITIYQLDVYTLFYEVKKNLHKFRLSEKDYLFIYDGFHPSAAVHKIIGQEAFQVVNRPKVRSRN